MMRMEAFISENRETIAVLVVCLVLTGGNVWLNRNSPPGNWVSMEQYGISFKYHKF